MLYHTCILSCIHFNMMNTDTNKSRINVHGGSTFSVSVQAHEHPCDLTPSYNVLKGSLITFYMSVKKILIPKSLTNLFCVTMETWAIFSNSEPECITQT